MQPDLAEVEVSVHQSAARINRLQRRKRIIQWSAVPAAVIVFVVCMKAGMVLGWSLWIAEFPLLAAAIALMWVKVKLNRLECDHDLGQWQIEEIHLLTEAAKDADQSRPSPEDRSSLCAEGGSPPEEPEAAPRTQASSGAHRGSDAAAS